LEKTPWKKQEQIQSPGRDAGAFVGYVSTDLGGDWTRGKLVFSVYLWLASANLGRPVPDRTRGGHRLPPVFC